jgi:hypothetical protein
MKNIIIHIQDFLQSQPQQLKLGLISHCYQIYTSYSTFYNLSHTKKK